ncbi:uncharacterized protein LOC111267867 isoform X2 [Varroa jacobsoni]|nr:uncharacterized protein LOC111267867 isoform X2 [Varroa jacobsoni]
MLISDLVRRFTCIYMVTVVLLESVLSLPTREQILELYHRAPQHIKDALARHGIHAHNLPSPASLATLHTSSLIANHPGLANSAFAGRLNLHALASRAQAILKRPPSQLPFPIPSFNKNNNNNAAQLQRRSGLVLSFPIKKPQQQQQQQMSVGVDGNDDTISRQLSSSRALAGPPPQIVTVPPHIEGLQLSNHHIKPVSTIINFGPPAASTPSSPSSSDSIITGRPMQEGQLPVKPLTPPTPLPSVPIPQPSSGLEPIIQVTKTQKQQRPETVVSARSFSNPFDDNPLSRPLSVPLNVRNPKYEYGGFVPISTNGGGGGSTSINSAAASPATNFVLSSPAVRSEKHVHFANGFVIEEEPAASSPRISGPVVPGAVVRDIAPYNLVKKTTALVETCQTSKQDFCVMDDESYPKLETEHFLRKCEHLLDAMYVRPNGGAGSQYNATIGGFAGSGSGVLGGRPLCDAERKAKRLAVARDIHGQWAVLIQAGRWPQKAHVTFCRDEGRPCQRLGGCSVKTRCVQRFAPQTLIALDPLNPEACPTLRAFALPSACECTSA